MSTVAVISGRAAPLGRRAVAERLRLADADNGVSSRSGPFASPTMRAVTLPDLNALSDRQLIARARANPGEPAEPCLAALYERHHRTVARWCFRICGDRESAVDLAQDVFLRVYERLDTFRGESRFTTWLYAVTRSVAINRSIVASRRRSLTAPIDDVAEPVDGGKDAAALAGDEQIAVALRAAMQRDLEPLEARVLLLHHVHGWTLARITERLELDNKSGAKAYLVAARRKLRKRFGRWLAAQNAPGETR